MEVVWSIVRSQETGYAGDWRGEDSAASAAEATARALDARDSSDHGTPTHWLCVVHSVCVSLSVCTRADY